MRPAPTVVKLGGSHAFSHHLPGWIAAIARHAGHIVVVPGGGPFADAVRDAQPKMGFDDAAAHHMALLAMEQYGRALAGLNDALVLADSPDAIAQALDARQVPVWAPARMALAATDIPPSWDITSDSLAAWLAGRIGAKRLLLVKHMSVEDAAMPVRTLIARGILDAAFADFLEAAGVPAFALGPTNQAGLSAIIAHETSAGTRIDP